MRTALLVVAPPACIGGCNVGAASASADASMAEASDGAAGTAGLTADSSGGGGAEAVDAGPGVEPGDAAPPKPPFAEKHYAKVLQTGDSMVGGGLCLALEPMFVHEGTKFVRDCWESQSIETFAWSTHIPDLIKKHHPDLVLVTLGANDVYTPPNPGMIKAIERVVKQTQTGGSRDCVWLGPPIWDPKYRPVVEAIRAHAAPCLFHDASDLELERRRDKIHPTNRGGAAWAADFWRFFRGDVSVASDGGIGLVSAQPP